MADINPYQTPFNPSDAVEQPVTSRSAARKAAELQGVRRGLFTLHYGILAILGALVLGPLAMFGAGWIGLEPLVGLATMLIIGTFAVGGISMFVGHCFCMFVPEHTLCKRFAVATVWLQVSAAAILIAVMALTWMTRVSTNSDTSATAYFLGIISTLFGVLTWGSVVSFLLFLKNLNEYIVADKFADTASSILQLAVGFLGASVLWFMFVYLYMGSDNVPPRIGLIVPLALIVFSFVIFGRYVNLIGNTAKAVARLSPITD